MKKSQDLLLAAAILTGALAIGTPVALETHQSLKSLQQPNAGREMSTLHPPDHTLSSDQKSLSRQSGRTAIANRTFRTLLQSPIDGPALMELAVAYDFRLMTLARYQPLFMSEPEILAALKSIPPNLNSNDENPDLYQFLILLNGLESDEAMADRLSGNLSALGDFYARRDFEKWLERSPEAALDWFDRSLGSGHFDEEPHSREFTQLFGAYLNHLGKTDVDLAIEAATSLSDAKHSFSLQQLNIIIAENHPDRALYYISSISDPELKRKTAIDLITRSFGYDNSSSALDLINEVATDSADTDTLILQTALGRLGHQQNSTERLDWIIEHASHIDPDAFAAQLSHSHYYSSSDSQAAVSNWLAIHQNRQLADPATAAVVLTSARSDYPKEMSTLIPQALTIQSPEIRTSTLRQLHGTVRSFPEQRQQLEQQLTAAGIDLETLNLPANP